MGTENQHMNEGGLPRIPLDLTQHKLSIALNWIPIVLTSCLLPIGGYFALRYGTDLKLNIILSPWLALMGVVSLFSLVDRSWALLRKDSICRPLGQTGRNLDFFGWNFMFGFIMLTVLISAGIAELSLTVASLPQSVLMVQVSGLLVLTQILQAVGVRAPFRLSSIAHGEVLRPGTYVIVEDICAVDGKQGQKFRQAWKDRYDASPIFRSHLRRMDLMWGVSGLLVAAGIWAVVLSLQGTRIKREIGYCIGKYSGPNMCAISTP